MIILYFLIPFSIAFAALFLCCFIWAVRSGQYDDTCTPSMRLLMDDEQGASLKLNPALPVDSKTFPTMPEINSSNKNENIQ